jgi:putative membrane protein
MAGARDAPYGARNDAVLTERTAMLTDWILACLHHIAIFSLAATLAAELALISLDLSAQSIRRLATIDLWYGILAGLVIVFGVMRVIWGAKGYEYYLVNHVFWTKMALFLAVGLLSILPALRYLAWGRKLDTEPAFLPPAAEVARVRSFLWLEAAAFLCIPITAAAMARGYGL